MRRGGQVFFVHNRVRTIGAMAEMLARVVPEVRVDRRPRADARARARGTHARLPARRGGRAALHDDHRERARHPACQHDPRQSRRRPGTRPALPAARTGRTQQPPRLRLSAGARNDGRAPRRRPEAARGDPGSVRARQRLPPRQHGPRDPRRGRICSAPSSRATFAAVGYETYMEMLEETIEELRGNIARGPDRSGDPAARGRAPARGLRRGREPAARALQAPRQLPRRERAVARSATRSSTATDRCPPRRRTCSR